MPVGLRQRERLAQMVAFAHEYKDPYGLKGGRFFESWLRLHPKSPRLAPVASKNGERRSWRRRSSK